jgi:hypothetical protein
VSTTEQPGKRRRRPPAAEVTPQTPIWCPACQEEHLASAFNKDRRRFSGLSVICRRAQAEARKTPEAKAATQERNKRRWADPEYRSKSLKDQRARRERLGATVDLRRARTRLQRIVEEWKQQGCVDCGYDDIRAIDPDHLDNATKDGHVSRLVQLCASAARIRAELEKCVPRCARCHRRITQQQRPCAWRTAEKLPPSWRRRLDFQDRNDAIKLGRGCADCGWRGWARGLDWDHVEGVKLGGIATLIANGRPWGEIEAEMAKCDVVCANCHRIRTAQRRSVESAALKRPTPGDQHAAEFGTRKEHAETSDG